MELHTAQSPLPTLYHYEPSYYSQVVRLAMEEEGVNYISRETDIHSKQEQTSDWYLKMNPAGVVPTLLWAGKPVCESKDISIFAVDNLSQNENGLLSVNRDEVLEMVELHYEQCLIEPLSFSTLASKNKVKPVQSSQCSLISSVNVDNFHCSVHGFLHQQEGERRPGQVGEIQDCEARIVL